MSARTAWLSLCQFLWNSQMFNKKCADIKFPPHHTINVASRKESHLHPKQSKAFTIWIGTELRHSIHFCGYLLHRIWSKEGSKVKPGFHCYDCHNKDNYSVSSHEDILHWIHANQSWNAESASSNPSVLSTTTETELVLQKDTLDNFL